MLASGIQTADAARRMGLGGSSALAWTGMGLVAAGTATLVAVIPEPQPYDVPLGIAGVTATVTGTALGVAQMARNGALERSRFAVAPTLQGFALAGRF